MGMLIYDYEEEHEFIPKLSHAELIQALMDESELELQDLYPFSVASLIYGLS